MQNSRNKLKKNRKFNYSIVNREKMMTIFDEKIEIRERERCKGVHCVDLGESFPTRIYLQKSASIQPRTSPSKFEGKFNSLFTPLLKQNRWRSQQSRNYDCSCALAWNLESFLPRAAHTTPRKLSLGNHLYQRMPFSNCTDRFTKSHARILVMTCHGFTENRKLNQNLKRVKFL